MDTAACPTHTPMIPTNEEIHQLIDCHFRDKKHRRAILKRALRTPEKLATIFGQREIYLIAP